MLVADGSGHAVPAALIASMVKVATNSQGSTRPVRSVCSPSDEGALRQHPKVSS